MALRESHHIELCQVFESQVGQEKEYWYRKPTLCNLIMVLPWHWCWGLRVPASPSAVGIFAGWQRCEGAFIELSGIVPRGNTFIKN